MKKIVFVLLYALLISSNSIWSQIPNGSIAPDFSITDINGIDHSLSDYLNDGKSVIIEFSSVGCGPSWKYHETEALKDFYNAYGLPGSNEIVVLFIEDSNWASLSDLQGVSNPPAFGDWTQGTPFPIVLDDNLHDLYEINFAPTIRYICPDGTINTIGMASSQSYLNTLSNNCNSLSGVENFGRVLDTNNGFCDIIGEFKSELKNYGSNMITSAVLNLKENGEIVSTKNYSGFIFQFHTETIEFNEIELNPTSEYTVEIESINGTPNFNPIYSTASLPFDISNEISNDLLLKVQTYICPQNMSWEIVNSSGEIVANGGPYESPSNNNNCGGPNANTTIEHEIQLPNVDDCYSINLRDSNGLGWKNYQGNAPQPTYAGIEVYSNDIQVYSKLYVENFGYLLELKNVLETTQALSLSDEELNEKISFFPNPSKGIVQIKTESQVKLEIYDLNGKLVYANINYSISPSLNLSSIDKGVYLIKVIGKNNKQKIQKLILY
ncbi:T9SS type A sorting domain-containing protein [Psychroserpens ponticola]|uniref:T9SS type A sorting domain-containing protein n=1 Tax=Psychroserpens ponticola TaxID=2932268 RepID=A0ABY7RSX1_9FLAO|nr:T9SS type A sorting domain-containing protein [Psychroserpens ponticola]WCO00220.1 T9SS type A sorting domain-containing protein [Psychroserpens ponticola]